MSKKGRWIPGFLKGIFSRKAQETQRHTSFKKGSLLSQALGGSANPYAVKKLIPTAWFTKKGPGIEKDTRWAFFSMTPRQRDVAISNGWVPEKWRSKKACQKIKSKG